MKKDIFFHPDCNRRYWNCTNSAKRPVDFTTDEEFHLALKIISTIDL